MDFLFCLRLFTQVSSQGVEHGGLDHRLTRQGDHFLAVWPLRQVISLSSARFLIYKMEIIKEPGSLAFFMRSI